MTSAGGGAPEPDLAALGAAVRRPDEHARTAATALLREAGGADGETPGAAPLGRVAELVGWGAAVQGRDRPQPFTRVRVVLVESDDPLAARPAAGALLADRADVGVRRLRPAAVGLPQRPVGAGATGARARERQERRARTAAALASGLAAVDAEVDAGADLLLPAAVEAGPSVGAAVVAAVLLGREPAEVVDRAHRPSDAGWVRSVVAVRDGLRRAKPSAADPLALLAAVDAPAFATLVGVVLGAAVRATPVLLDAPETAVAALVVQRWAPRSAAWTLAASRSGDALHDLALARLERRPVLDLGVRRGGAVGALLALPLLQAALALAPRDDGAPPRPDAAPPARPAEG